MEGTTISQTAALRRHLGLNEGDDISESITPPKIQPLFFVERSPTGRARCKLTACNEFIGDGQYRIALHPGMSGPTYYASKNADLYHVACFEKIADLSKADFLDRISPVTRSTFNIRNIKGMSVLDGNYLCDGAVERLVLEWKVQRGAWIDKSEGKEEKSLEESMPDFYQLLYNAGSSKFKAPGSIPNMSTFEYFVLLTTLAPCESDGPDDADEWNLFDTFLSKEQESWHDPHDLSKMLTKWEKYVELVNCTNDDLDEHEIELKATIGEKGTRAINRLSAIPMPDMQGLMRGH